MPDRLDVPLPVRRRLPDEHLAAAHRCPLCRHPVTLTGRPDARCPACQSPLARLPDTADTPSPGHGSRRGAVRRDQRHVAWLHAGWPSLPLAVRWRDLSLTGLSLFVPQAFSAGQRLRVSDHALDVVAEVVGCRPQGRLQVVHARLLTAQLLQSTGVFVSTQA